MKNSDGFSLVECLFGVSLLSICVLILSVSSESSNSYKVAEIKAQEFYAIDDQLRSTDEDTCVSLKGQNLNGNLDDNKFSDAFISKFPDVETKTESELISSNGGIDSYITKVTITAQSGSSSKLSTYHTYSTYADVGTTTVKDCAINDLGRSINAGWVEANYPGVQLNSTWDTTAYALLNVCTILPSACPPDAMPVWYIALYEADNANHDDDNTGSNAPGDAPIVIYNPKEEEKPNDYYKLMVENVSKGGTVLDGGGSNDGGKGVGDKGDGYSSGSGSPGDGDKPAPPSGPGQDGKDGKAGSSGIPPKKG